MCANGCGTECAHENQTGNVCEICGIELHTCDFTGEWKADADKHWKECECGLISEEGTHTGGTATCISGKLCETCGNEYGEVDADNHDWSNGNGMCANCGEADPDAIASVSKNGNVIGCYTDLKEAINAVAGCTEDDKAVVKLLDNIDVGKDYIEINSGVFTFELNSKTMSGRDLVLRIIDGAAVTVQNGAINRINSSEDYGPALVITEATASVINCAVTSDAAMSCGVSVGRLATVEIIDSTVSAGLRGLYVDYGGHVTVSGDSEITSNINGIEVFNDSTVEIRGGTIIAPGYGVCSDGSPVTISGGTIYGDIEDLYADNYYYNGNPFKLICSEGKDEGPSFPDGITVSGVSLKEIVGEGFAYWQDGKMIVPEEGQNKILGYVVIKAECTHENQTGNVCEICGISLHTCDFTGEWKTDSEKHWKECECGLLSEEGTHEYMESYPMCRICYYFEGTEIAVGETISIDNEELIKFAPEVSGTYILSSFGGGNPYVNLYNGEMFPLESANDYGDSKNFRLEYEFTEGEVYYFEFVDSEFRFGYQIKLECETHSGSTQTCGGYKCDVCGELFGEGIGEHTGGTQNCSGYKCEVCGKYYGESIGEHVGGEATCTKKAVCDVCGEEYGELDKDNHTFDGITCGYYGVTGDEQSVWWIFEDGILTIGGTGAMADRDDYRIPWYSFREEITAVAISDGVTRIGRNAFAECRALSSVVIPASVETIGYNAFGRCTSLENVTFAEGSQLTAIEESAFYFCYVLKQITLPEKVNNIHPTAFYYSDVIDFIVDENNTTYKAIEGLLCSADGTLVIYPSGRTSNTFTTPEGVTAIGELAFENCTSLNYITLSEGIKTIEEGAFVGSGLETVTISSTVTSISENAFHIVTILIPLMHPVIGTAVFTPLEKA